MYTRWFQRLAPLVAAAWFAGAALANEPVKLVVPFPAGGGLDLTGRLLADKLRAALNKDVVVENKAGANGNVGATAVATAKPDGNTLLMASDGLTTVNPVLYKNSPFKASDLRPVAMVATVPQLLVVPTNSPIKSFADMVTTGKARELTYASGGIGSGGHLAMAFMGHQLGLKSLHVPYQGAAPAMTALLGQQVDAAFLILPSALAQVKSGKLRALAVSGSARWPDLPDVPSVAELGYKELVMVQGFLLMAPAKWDDTEVKVLADKLDAIGKDAAFRKALADSGLQATAMGPADTTQWLRRETQRWTKVIQDNNIEGR
jgi:tripartite-type tricarboxylate transporter receptor subunit TctC